MQHPNPKTVIDYSAEVELRRNNPSVKHAWEERCKMGKKYSEYSIKIRQGNGLISDHEQEHLLALDAIALEKFRNYSFVLKLARD